MAKLKNSSNEEQHAPHNMSSTIHCLTPKAQGDRDCFVGRNLEGHNPFQPPSSRTISNTAKQSLQQLEKGKLTATGDDGVQPEDILKPDGSNLQQWEHLLQLHVLERFGKVDFYTLDETSVIDPSNKKIGQGIINASVHTDLTYVILGLQLSAGVSEHLMLKFRVVNRAAQIQAWTSFIQIDPSKHNTTASLHEAFSSAWKSFGEQGLSLTWDKLQGLCQP
ncbi:uncharacterized protein VP01_441g7 [Puccinia sorghi]|uniref:Uncharacterized protein n=1 Tax=Puccinia sorghi TaxID=27349 RepID=A0A0L6UPK8_9BASI|nr:uncharacterized protein VP01_441g7 [Puccinia sorghi]